MNLRTITVWVIYSPKRQAILSMRQFKYELKDLFQPDGSVIIRMEGHYVRKRKK